jgi:hypothetical protein
MFESLTEAEKIEMWKLWQVRSLLKQINDHPKGKLPHIRLWSDDSGGIFQYRHGVTGEYVELTDSWGSIEEAIEVLRDYLSSLG